MKYEEIMQEIESNLTGNFNEDKEFLFSQLEKYKDHPMGLRVSEKLLVLLHDLLYEAGGEKFTDFIGEFIPPKHEPLSGEVKNEVCLLYDQVINDSLFDGSKKEITDEFFRLAYDSLSEGDKKHFPKLNLDIPVNCFNQLINGEDIEESLNILDDFFEDLDFLFKSDDQIEYHCFNNPLEEVLFNEFCKTNKEVKIIPGNNDLADLYHFYSILLFSFEEYTKAEDMLKKSLEYNPVYLRGIFTLIGVYRVNYDFEAILSLIEDGFKFAYMPMDVARLYTNLGDYYIEMEDYDSACASYKSSLKYYDDPDIHPIIDDLYKNHKIKDMNIMEISIKEGKILTVHPYILFVLYNLIETNELDNLIEGAIFFSEMHYNLSFDSDLKKKISYLKSQLSKEKG